MNFVFLKVENQKKLLEKKDKEADSLKKQNSSLRETIERLDREKLLLNTRLKNLQKVSSKNSTKESGFTETQIYIQVIERIVDESTYAPPPLLVSAKYSFQKVNYL